MAVKKPGDFITTHCRRCSDVTGHTVMLVIDGAIERVECRACGSQHKFRESTAKSKRASSPSVRHVRRGQSRESARELGKKSEKRLTKKARESKSAWQEAMVKHRDSVATPYTLHTPLEKNMFIEHQVFGRGEVISLIKPDKAEILFEDGVKLLKCTLSSD